MTLTPTSGLRLGVRLAFAHHPLCSNFASDVLQMGNVALCSGCLALWPAFLAGLAMGILVLGDGVSALPLLVASVTTGWAQLATYLSRTSRLERACAKAVLGLGIGIGTAALVAVGLPWPVVLAMVTAGALGALGLQAIRMRSILRTCDACPYRRDWDACPGFAGAGPAVPGGPRSLLER